MPRNGFHVRRHAEYVRLARALLLHEEFPNEEDRYYRFVRGAGFHPDPFTGTYPAGSLVQLELVPEKFNPHDAQAVAVDHGGSRIGYLPAGTAAGLHDVLGAANRAGFAVWTCGRLDRVELDGPPRLLPAVSVPTFQATSQLIQRFGLDEVLHRLLAAVGATVRAELLASAWEPLPPPLLRILASHAATFPELTWPTNPPRGVHPREQAPGLLYGFLRDLVVAERQAQAEAKRQAAVAHRAEREAKKVQDREDRARNKQEARGRQREAVSARLAQGWTIARIAVELGVGIGTVQSLKGEADPAQGANHNTDELLARMARARAVLDMQLAGLSRDDIARRMQLGKETVKELLRDAKFHADRRTDPPRLSTARAAACAQQSGVTRQQFATMQHLSAAKAAEAWRDAKILTAEVGPCTDEGETGRRLQPLPPEGWARRLVGDDTVSCQTEAASADAANGRL